MITFARIDPTSLGSRAKENYNFHQIAAQLSTYGYHSIRLSDDWNGADFVAIHIDGNSILAVQQKSKPTISKRYEGKQLWMAIPDEGNVFLYLHDEMVAVWKAAVRTWPTNESWERGEDVFWTQPPAWLRSWLADHRL